MLKSKPCYRRCPKCQKSSKGLCQYDESKLTGFLGIDCQFCGFKNNDFQPIEEKMTLHNFILNDYKTRKPKTGDNSDI